MGTLSQRRKGLKDRRLATETRDYNRSSTGRRSLNQQKTLDPSALVLNEIQNINQTAVAFIGHR